MTEWSVWNTTAALLSTTEDVTNSTTPERHLPGMCPKMSHKPLWAKIGHILFSGYFYLFHSHNYYSNSYSSH